MIRRSSHALRAERVVPALAGRGTDPAAKARRTSGRCERARRYGRASRTMLNGVSVARRKRVNPPLSTRTCRRRRSPAWAPRADPCRASDTGTQINDEAP